jgi:hypothetical protein
MGVAAIFRGGGQVVFASRSPSAPFLAALPHFAPEELVVADRARGRMGDERSCGPRGPSTNAFD